MVRIQKTKTQTTVVEVRFRFINTLRKNMHYRKTSARNKSPSTLRFINLNYKMRFTEKTTYISRLAFIQRFFGSCHSELSIVESQTLNYTIIFSSF